MGIWNIYDCHLEGTNPDLTPEMLRSAAPSPLGRLDLERPAGRGSAWPHPAVCC